MIHQATSDIEAPIHIGRSPLILDKSTIGEADFGLPRHRVFKTSLFQPVF